MQEQYITEMDQVKPLDMYKNGAVQYKWAFFNVAGGYKHETAYNMNWFCIHCHL
jgi:hypothetical protein